MAKLQNYYTGLYKIACEKWTIRAVLYRNRLYKGAFYLWKCYILNSKNEILNITDKNYIIIN